MKKRTLLVALLVIPMGAALAWHEDGMHTPSGATMNQDEYEAVLGTQAVTGYRKKDTGEAMLGTQSGMVTTGGGPETEAMLGTQAATVRQSGSEPMLGTQSSTGYITTGGALGTQSYGR